MKIYNIFNITNLKLYTNRELEVKELIDYLLFKEEIFKLKKS